MLLFFNSIHLDLPVYLPALLLFILFASPHLSTCGKLLKFHLIFYCFLASFVFVEKARQLSILLFFSIYVFVGLLIKFTFWFLSSIF